MGDLGQPYRSCEGSIAQRRTHRIYTNSEAWYVVQFELVLVGDLSFSNLKCSYFFSFFKVCTIRVDQKTGNLYWVSCDELSVGATHIVLPEQSVSNQLYQASGAISDLFVDWQRGQLYWLEDSQIIHVKLGLLGGNAKAIYSSEDQSLSHVVYDRKAHSFLWNSQNGV